MSARFGPRRGEWIGEVSGTPLVAEEVRAFEQLDAAYRALCAILYNYAPTSGHPGGSISSGRFVSMLLFDTMNYDFRHPDREDADVISYAAGHKALGLYAMWALRNEVMRIAAPELLPPAGDHENEDEDGVEEEEEEEEGADDDDRPGQDVHSNEASRVRSTRWQSTRSGRHTTLSAAATSSLSSP